MRRLSALAAFGLIVFFGDVARLRSQVDDAAPQASREYAIKAAYLYQFGRYIQWPAAAFADSRSPLVLGVLGEAPFGDALNEIARTRRIQDRPVVVHRFASMAEYVPCHILFVTAEAGPVQTAAAIGRVKNDPVFLVGEVPGFVQQGGVANFFLQENGVRFELSVKAARQKHLVLSSKLLGLASIVDE